MYDDKELNTEKTEQTEQNQIQQVQEPEQVQEPQARQEEAPAQEPVPQEQPQQAESAPQITFESINNEPDAPKKKSSHMGLKIAAIALVCALLGSIGGGTLVGRMVYNKFNPQTQEDEAPQPETAVASTESGYSDPIVVTTNTSGAEMSPSDIFSTYSKAVVGINCETTANVFGQTSTTASSGSGFIITADGYVVTNHHVIDSADTVNVMLQDETSYPAEVVGYDEDNDVALLKIQATGLPTVSVGDSDTLKVGEQVVAIGNPLGELTHTLTVGYISAMDREINTDGNPINMLQTDAAINSGNSGGPLFDSHGNVCGITTAKYASSSIEGLGFAIPINDAMNIVYSIQQYGYVKGKPSFGITVASLSLTYASYYGLPVGCYVNEVVADSGAEKGGMLPGDIITHLGDVAVQDVTGLTAELKNYKAGDTVKVTVYRQGETVELNVTLDEKLPDYMQTQEEPQEEEQPQQTAQPSQGSGQSGYGGYGYGFDPFSFFFGGGSSSNTPSSDPGTAA